MGRSYALIFCEVRDYNKYDTGDLKVATDLRLIHLRCAYLHSPIATVECSLYSD